MSLNFVPNGKVWHTKRPKVPQIGISKEHKCESLVFQKNISDKLCLIFFFKSTENRIKIFKWARSGYPVRDREVVHDGGSTEIACVYKANGLKITEWYAPWHHEPGEKAALVHRHRRKTRRKSW